MWLCWCKYITSIYTYTYVEAIKFTLSQATGSEVHSEGRVVKFPFSERLSQVIIKI